LAERRRQQKGPELFPDLLFSRFPGTQSVRSVRHIPVKRYFVRQSHALFAEIRVILFDIPFLCRIIAPYAERYIL
jgi:hypothetical protein